MEPAAQKPQSPYHYSRDKGNVITICESFYDYLMKRRLQLYSRSGTLRFIALIVVCKFLNEIICIYTGSRIKYLPATHYGLMSHCNLRLNVGKARSALIINAVPLTHSDSDGMTGSVEWPSLVLVDCGIQVSWVQTNPGWIN